MLSQPFDAVRKDADLLDAATECFVAYSGLYQDKGGGVYAQASNPNLCNVFYVLLLFGLLL